MISVKTTKADKTTKLRDREEHSLRNWTAESTLLEVFAREVSEWCVINLNATTYAMTKSGLLGKVWSLLLVSVRMSSSSGPRHLPR